MDKLWVAYLGMTANIILQKKHHTLTMHLKSLVSELRGRIMSLTDNPSVRIDPFHISLFGASGLGKSYLASIIAHVLGRSQNIPTEDCFYPRTPTMDHWDNYKCQEWIGFDDIDQQDTEELAGEMITIKSNVPKVLPMAHLETKGCLFSSRGLITTTNVAYPEPASLKCKEAYKRRRNILVECSLIPGMGQDREQRHLAFFIRDSVDSKAPPLFEHPFNFPELIAYLADRYSHYQLDQIRLVKSVAPDTDFKKVYVYNRDEDESRLKLFQLLEEVFERGGGTLDPHIGNLNDIETADLNELEYDAIDPENMPQPEQFPLTHNLKPKSRLEIEDSDIEEEWHEDEMFLDPANGDCGEDEECNNPFCP
jgi:hypothetical protein